MKFLVTLGVFLVGCAAFGGNGADVRVDIQKVSTPHPLHTMMGKLMFKLGLSERENEEMMGHYAIITIARLMFDLIDDDEDGTITHSEFTANVPRGVNSALKESFTGTSLADMQIPDETYEFTFRLIAGSDEKLPWVDVAKFFNTLQNSNPNEVSKADSDKMEASIFTALDEDKDGQVTADDMFRLIPKEILRMEPNAYTGKQTVREFLTDNFNKCKKEETEKNKKDNTKKTEAAIVTECAMTMGGDLIGVIMSV